MINVESGSGKEDGTYYSVQGQRVGVWSGRGNMGLNDCGMYEGYAGINSGIYPSSPL